MQLISHSAPIYYPEAEQNSVLRLGLQPLPVTTWFQPDEDFALFQKHKLQQGELRLHSVYEEQPGSEQAVAELTRLVQQHLLQDHADTYCLQDDCLLHKPSGLRWMLPAADLWQVSLWVQEDICVLQECNGEFVLSAASVCSPSNWYPAAKIGCNLDVIHGPVPGYGETLSRRVNSLCRELKPHKPLLRYNWSLQPGNELYWHSDRSAAQQSESQYWRVERQTLRRLPVTGAVIFTIRIYLHARSQIESTPFMQERLAALLARLPAAERAYKGLP